MKIYKQQNVYDAALDRIRYLFDEFEEVIVGFSGGKDSTVTLNLAIQVAKEKGRAPVKVLFLDQEAEWQTVIDYVRRTMDRDDVIPLWYQMPLKIFNSTSTLEHWLMCWEEGKTWMREREPDAITENRYGTDRFAELFEKILAVDYADKKTCYLAGVRCEESPSRFIGLTSNATYKRITYGKILNRKLDHYTFYPLYDWSYSDVWKAIHDNKWDYCEIYNYMYQYGIHVRDMRVSNVHHETAVKNLYYLQEIERDTWNKLTQRVSGINTAGQLKEDSFIPKELPPMFESWAEYRDYLLENLLVDPESKGKFKARFDKMDQKYRAMHHISDMHKAHVAAILTNDYHFTKLNNWETNPLISSWRKYQAGVFTPNQKNNKYIHG